MSCVCVCDEWFVFVCESCVSTVSGLCLRVSCVVFVFVMGVNVVCMCLW